MRSRIIISFVFAIAIVAAITGCKSDSKSNPVAANPYANDWFPLANNIAAVWENTDYDSMGMAGMMYVDTSRCMMRMRGSTMYYEYGNDLGEREAFPNDTITLIVRNDSIFARDLSVTTGTQEVLEAILPPHTGTVWNGDWDNLPTRWSSVGQTLTVPAGTFTNVAILQQGPTTADSSYKQFWCAQGVGVIQVKMWMDYPDSTHPHNVMPMHMMQLRKIMYP